MPTAIEHLQTVINERWHHTTGNPRSDHYSNCKQDERWREHHAHPVIDATLKVSPTLPILHPNEKRETPCHQ
jgi:hypothetical protein